MIKLRLTRLAVMLLLCLLCMAGFCLPATAEEAGSGVNTAICATVKADTGEVRIFASDIGEDTYLFLPSCAELTRLTLTVDGLDVAPLRWQSEDTERFLPFRQGEAVDWTAVADEREEGVLSAALVREADGEKLLRLCVMKSENLRSLYLASDDPVNQGRAWLEDCEKHERETSASMALLSADGKIDHADDITKLRGRGNSTWMMPKNGYQFKLKSKADLLNTGIKDERNRTWVLLSEVHDPTLLHNRISFDMALELGLKQTSRSEHVDLYYDGDYCGLYLLCEKVEVNEGRVDVVDYDDIIEMRNGVSDDALEMIQPIKAQNSYGNEYTYIPGITNGERVDEGGYLLEIEGTYTLSDPCWFTMSNGKVFASKNPEYASNEMMIYIMDVMEETWKTLDNRGINPDTGLGIDDYIDVDAFARTALINELSRNIDSFSYSSTFFVLPAGERRLEPGPIWDFDFAYAIIMPSLAKVNPNWTGVDKLKDSNGWLPALYACEVFRDKVRQVFFDELYPIITDILLGDKQGTYLRPLNEYVAEIDGSRRMNDKLWGALWAETTRFSYPDTYEENIAFFRDFILKRSEWFHQYIVDWPQIDADTVTFSLDAVYTDVSNTLRLLRTNTLHNGVARSVSEEQLTEATEDAYATWRCTAIIDPIVATPFGDNVHVTVNGVELPCEKQEDGSLKLTFVIDDLSYRPVYYEGEDIGLVFDYETYIANYPEVEEMCGGDPDAVLAYFCDEGMYEGQAGNAFCIPKKILYANYDLMDVLGEDWYNYYFEFIYNTDRTIWMANAGMRFELPVRAE